VWTPDPRGSGCFGTRRELGRSLPGSVTGVDLRLGKGIGSKPDDRDRALARMGKTGFPERHFRGRSWTAKILVSGTFEHPGLGCVCGELCVR